MKFELIIIVPLLIAAAAAVFCLENNPHRFSREDCVTCHRIDGQGRVASIREPVTGLCDRCHHGLFEEGYMHPVDIRPDKVGIPGDFPLSSSGKITCATCHDVHSSSETPFGTSSHLLRRYESGKAFCDICHIAGPGAEGHKTMLGEAHFRSKYIVTDPSEEIDPMSKNCISCHDGSFASSVTIMAGIWQHRPRSSASHGMENHPIGIDYETARTRPGRKTDLIPLPMVDKRIQFFDGKLGCGSCHNPFSGKRKDLVLSNRRSRLCFACHMIDR